MTKPTLQGYEALTDKEKQTLRLIVRGHDAKSVAVSLGLSVHTINERLRDARRKMAVSSSRAAARLLLEREGPHFCGDATIGEAGARTTVEPVTGPEGGERPTARRPLITIGVASMTLALALVALTALPQTPPAPAPQVEPAAAEIVTTARAWLVLLDQARWDDSYRLTGKAFQALNTVEVWTATSQQVRAPFGAARSRTLVSHEVLPAPPQGYDVVKFRSSFANRADVLETVTLSREAGGWRVVGVMIG